MMVKRMMNLIATVQPVKTKVMLMTSTMKKSFFKKTMTVGHHLDQFQSTAALRNTRTRVKVFNPKHATIAEVLDILLVFVTSLEKVNSVIYVANQTT